MNNSILKAIMKLIQKDPNIIILTADNGFLQFEPLRKMMPDKFLNFGIAEASMVTFAAGLESCGKIPYVITMATFLVHRAFEQIRNDICVQARNVKMVGVGCGLNYSLLGSSHHAIDDVAATVSLPNLTVYSPCGIAQASRALTWAHQVEGPVYVRFNDTAGFDDTGGFFNEGKSTMLKYGNDMTIVCTGDLLPEVIKAHALLEAQGIHASVLYMPSLKPFDEKAIIEVAGKTKKILTAEEHLICGGLATLTQTALGKQALKPYIIKHIGIEDRFPDKYGSYESLLDFYGLSDMHIARMALKMVDNSRQSLDT